MSDRTSVVERARADLAAGEPWRARERLNGAFANDRGNAEIIEMLGEVYAQMGDLPAAGRWWYLSAADDGRHDEARAAYEARHGHRAEEIRGQLPRFGPDLTLAASVLERLEAIGWEPTVPDAQEPAATEQTVLGRASDALFLTGLVLATAGIWLVGLVWLIQAIV
jgi:hypothetical protein